MLFVYLLYFFSCIFAAITVVISKNKYNTIWNHYLFYNALWLVLIFLSIFCNNYLFPVEAATYIIFLISLFFFNITIWLVRRKNLSRLRIRPILLSLRKRRILEVSVLVCLLPGAIVNFLLIKAGVPMYEINYDYWTQTRSSGAYLYLQFQELFLFPISLILISSIFYSNYDITKKSSYLYTLLFGISLSGCYFLIRGGGRAEIMILFFVIVLSYIAKNVKFIKQYIHLPNKKLIVLSLIILAVVIQFANVERGKDGSLIENAINGYIIFAPLFEYYLNSDVFSNNTFGASLFEPIVLWLQYPLKIWNETPYPTTINDITQQFVYLPQYGKEYNNQVSACFVYMRDFGWIGIVIGPMITAWLYNFLFNLCTKNTFMFLLYFTYVLRLCGTNINFQLNKVFVFAIIYAFLFCKFFQIKNISNMNIYTRC